MGSTPGCSGPPTRNMGFLHKQYTSIAFQEMPVWHMGQLAIARFVIAGQVMPRSTIAR